LLTYELISNSVPNCDPCEEYAQALRDFVGTIPGWKSGGGVITFAGSSRRQGLELVDNNNAHPDLMKKIIAAFSSAGIPLKQISSEQLPQSLDAIIVISRHPR
jgi:hypothetical protein